MLDERIHCALYRFAHSQTLEILLGHCYVLALRIWCLALDRSQELKSTREIRCRLLQAICDRRSEDASALMRAAVRDYEDTMRTALLPVG